MKGGEIDKILSSLKQRRKNPLTCCDDSCLSFITLREAERCVKDSDFMGSLGKQARQYSKALAYSRR